MRRGSWHHRCTAGARGTRSMSMLSRQCLLLLAATTLTAQAATTVRLPAWVCARPDALFIDGFEGGNAVVRLPSGGSGGALGNVTRTLTVPAWGTRTVHAYVPPDHSPTQPMPLVLALHGQAGSPAAADAQAQAVRNAWAAVAATRGFIVIAPVASGAGGSWIVPDVPDQPSDYSTFATAIADAESAWNIDRSRRIGWGFSAGGHVIHDLVLNHYSTQVTIDHFAAHAVSAGALAGLACSGMSGAQCDALVAAASRRIPVDFHVGTSDPLFAQTLADSERFLAAGWQEGVNLWFTPFPGGHTYASVQLEQIWTNLCPFQVLP